MADDGWAPWATRTRVSSTRPPKGLEDRGGAGQTAAKANAAPSDAPPHVTPPADMTPAVTPPADVTAPAGMAPPADLGPTPIDLPSPAAIVEARSEREWAPAAEPLEIETTRRSGRAPLSRLAIVAAALRVIDADGFEALNMRRLGQELGVGAMAVYRHVRDKDQLLDLVIEGVLRDVERPELTGDWRQDAARIARATREGLMRHRRAVALVASRPWVGPAGLDGIDVTLGVFRRAGLDDRLAVFAQFALGNFVQGFCAWESANLGAASDDPAARAQVLAGFQALVASLPRDRFPNLVDLAPAIVAGPLDDRFEFGLQALLDGIEAAARGTAGGARQAGGSAHRR